VGVVFDQGALDAVMDVAGAEGGCFAASFGDLGGVLVKFLGDGARDGLHELAIGVIVDVTFFFAGQEEVGEGAADGIGDFSHVEVTLGSSDVDFDGAGGRGGGDSGGQGAPVETGLLVFWSLGDSAENFVFLEQICDHGGRKLERDFTERMRATGEGGKPVPPGSVEQAFQPEGLQVVV
jgi:hypothetical protein